MPRRSYTDEDRARVFTILATNDGNIDRTVRDSGVPRATVLSWKRKWETEGAPPEIAEAAEAAASDFIEKATTVRYKAITALEGKVDQASARDLATIIGILTDKIDRAEAVKSGRDRVEHVHVHALPAPEDLGPMLGDYLKSALGAARRRDAVIIEVPEEPAEDAEFKALPPGRD